MSEVPPLDVKELSAKYDAVVKELEVVKANYAKELGEMKAESVKALSAADERIKMLEKRPEPIGQLRELSDNVPASAGGVSIDKKRGVICKD